MNVPMREKYVDEAVGIWVIFGENRDGTVDVADQQKDIFQSLPRDKAQKIVNLQQEFRDKLYEVLCR